MAKKKTTINGLGKRDGDLGQAQNTRHIEFDKTVQEILNAKEHDQLFIALSLDIRQFHVESRYDAAFILNEAYMRGKAKIEKGEEIGGGNYRGWLRVAGRNIVKELSRDTKKNDSLNEFKLESLTASPTDWPNETTGTVDQKVMREAFAQLSQLEQIVLYAKIVDGWRWKDIRETLIKSGHKPMTENHLSQIKRRALKKLKAYFEGVQSAY